MVVVDLHQVLGGHIFATKSLGQISDSIEDDVVVSCHVEVYPIHELLSVH